jgi:hypothetical protein
MLCFVRPGSACSDTLLEQRQTGGLSVVFVRPLPGARSGHNARPYNRAPRRGRAAAAPPRIAGKMLRCNSFIATIE